MKLSELLQKKEDLHTEISRLKKILHDENSVVKGNTRSADLPKVKEQLEETLAELAKVKVAIQKANLPIYPKIFRYDSLKELKRTFESMRTRDGKFVLRNNETIEFDATYTKADVATLLAKIDAEIRTIRDELTVFNNNTEITE